MRRKRLEMNSGQKRPKDRSSKTVQFSPHPIAAQTWPRFCHQIAPNQLWIDMSQQVGTNTLSHPSEASTIGEDRLSARRRVMLQSTAHVEGDLLHQDLAMEQGAYFQGESRRAEDPLALPKQRKNEK